MIPRYYRRTWLDDAKPGDVIRFKSGSLRTVVKVVRSDCDRSRGRPFTLSKGLVIAIHFPILHCSWTERGHTILNRTDLFQRAECLTRAKVNLQAYPAARALLHDLELRGPARAEGSACCDVIGVFS